MSVSNKPAFAAVEVSLAPITAAGPLYSAARIAAASRRHGTSMTAASPLGTRWLLHETGARDDEAASRLFVRLAGMSRVESPETQHRKRTLLAEAAIDPGGVTFLLVDFDREPWLDRMVAEGFDPGWKTFVLREGEAQGLALERWAPYGDPARPFGGLVPATRDPAWS